MIEGSVSRPREEPAGTFFRMCHQDAFLPPIQRLRLNRMGLRGYLTYDLGIPRDIC